MFSDFGVWIATFGLIGLLLNLYVTRHRLRQLERAVDMIQREAHYGGLWTTGRAWRIDAAPNENIPMGPKEFGCGSPPKGFLP